MRKKKDQHTVGTPLKPRGQQTGMAGNPDQNREEEETTPAVRGRRKLKNRSAADTSHQQIGSDPTKPSTNTPSTPGMVVKPKSDPGGEGRFKRRLAKKRKTRG